MRQDAKPNIEAVMSDPAWAAQTRMEECLNKRMTNHTYKVLLIACENTFSLKACINL